MAVGQKFHCFVEDLYHGVHDFSSHELKIMLTLTAPVVTNTVKANLTEIAAGFGYTAGGAVVNITSEGQTAGIYSVIGDDIVFTAAGGPIADFRYAGLYNNTAASKNLIAFWDYGGTVTKLDTQIHTVDFDQILGILRGT